MLFYVASQDRERGLPMMQRRTFLSGAGAGLLVGTAAQAQRTEKTFRVAIVHTTTPTELMRENAATPQAARAASAGLRGRP